MIRDSIVMPGSVIKKGAVVQYSILAENVTVEEGASVGERPEKMEVADWGITVIGANVNIGKKAVVCAKQMIGSDVKGAEQ